MEKIIGELITSFLTSVMSDSYKKVKKIISSALSEVASMECDKNDCQNAIESIAEKATKEVMLVFEVKKK